MELLIKYIKESGFKVKFIAEKLGITYQGLKYKLDGETGFTASEAIALKDLLNISSEDFQEIFK